MDINERIINIRHAMIENRRRVNFIRERLARLEEKRRRAANRNQRIAALTDDQAGQDTTVTSTTSNEMEE